MYLANRVRNRDTGAAVVGNVVNIRKVNAGAAVDTATTDANGRWEKKLNGCAGYVEWVATESGQTKIVAGDQSFQFGAWFSGEVEKFLAAYGTGVIAGVDNELVVGAPGGMNVSVNTGAAIIKGMPYVQWASANYVIGANGSADPRIDRVVVKVYRTTDFPKTEIYILAGTPAASPTPPALTQTAAVWEISLAQVAVASGAAAINAGNLTDERTFAAPPIGNGSITNAMLAGSIDAAKINTGVVSNTEFNYLDGVTSAIQTQLDGKVADFTQYLMGAVMFGDGSTVIATTEPPGIIPCPETGTIVLGYLESIVGGSGNLRVNVLKAPAGSTTYTAIDAAAPLELSAASLKEDSTLTGWTLAVTQGDRIKVEIDAAVTPTNIKLAACGFRYSKARS